MNKDSFLKRLQLLRETWLTELENEASNYRTADLAHLADWRQKMIKAISKTFTVELLIRSDVYLQSQCERVP